MLFFGSNVIVLMPLPVVSGVVIFLGLAFLDEWLLTARRNFPLADYLMILVVFLPIVFLGFLEGLIVGLVATVLFFVIRFSVLDTIDSTFSGVQRRSMRVRPVPHQAILLEHGEQIHGYQLRGYIFFGSAARTIDNFRNALTDDPPLRCLLLDFSQISGVDISAINAFHRFIMTAQPSGTKVVLSSVPEYFSSALRRRLPTQEWQSLDFPEDLDQGLERCEDALIAEWELVYATEDEARGRLFDLSVEEMTRFLDRQARFEDLTERLRPWLLSCEYDAGRIIAARLERQEGMQLLAAGRAAARESDSNARLAEFGPGDVLTPKAAFGNHVAYVDIVAEQPCKTLLLTQTARRLLERDDPVLALELDRYVMNSPENG